MPAKFICRDYTDSRRVDQLDAHGERFFSRLMMKADDHGRILDDDQLLNSTLFPLKRDIRDTDIARWKAACLRAGLLHCYVDAKGRSIVEIFNFGQKKKFMRSNFDPPDGQQNFPLAPTKEVEVEGKRRTSAPPVENKNGHSKEIATRASCNPPGRAALPRSQADHQVRPTNGKYAREAWQLLADEKTLTARINQERESTKPDRALLESLKQMRQTTREEMKATP